MPSYQLTVNTNTPTTKTWKICGGAILKLCNNNNSALVIATKRFLWCAVRRSLWNMPFHAPKGDFQQSDTTRRDLTASLLTEVCHEVSIEPDLQPLTGETF